MVASKNKINIPLKNSSKNQVPIFGYPLLCSYIYTLKSIIMKKIELTRQEWKDSLRVPTPHRNKKKYFRKEKFKKGGNQFGYHL